MRLTLNSLQQYCGELNDGDEVLIVDNNSNDQTKNTVLEFKNSLPIAYFFEGRQGLSAARNKALSEFSNSVIIFIDDDITISKGFFNTYRQAFLTYAGHGFFGGRIEVDWGEKQPYWYKSNDLPMINGLIVNYDLGSENQQFKNTTLLPYGANFAIKKDVIQQVGEFNTKLGVQGKQLGRGEETDYFRRILKNGINGMYIADAKVDHRFHNQRVTLPYLYRYGIQKGTAAVLLDEARPQNTVFKIMYQLFAGIYQLMKLRVDRFYQCVINIGVLKGIYITCLAEEESNNG